MKKRSLYFLSLLTALATLGSPMTGESAPGDLDQSFQPGQAANGYIDSIHLQPDGKIVVGGKFNFFDNTRRHGIARLHPDGSHDLSFDPGEGIELSGSTPTIKVIVPQTGDKILIGGKFTSFDGTPRKSLARLDSDGRLDPSFTCPLNLNEVSIAAVQDDGKILVAEGDIRRYGDGLLVRLHADGSVDTSFVPAVQTVTLGKYEYYPVEYQSLVIQPDGKILVMAEYSCRELRKRKFQIHRLEADGSVDDSFNLELGGDIRTTGLALQQDGRILVGCATKIVNNAGYHTSLRRFNRDGSSDRSQVSLYDDYYHPIAIAVQQDGKIIVRSERLTRFNQDLTTDGSFMRTNNTNSNYQIALQKDGKILLARYKQIIRFEGDPVEVVVTPLIPDTWTPFYDQATFFYNHFASLGDPNTGLAFWFYFRAYGDQAYYKAHGDPATAQFKFYQGLAFFFYTFYKNTDPKNGAYFLYLYFAYAYYESFNQSGDSASANSYFATYYALALALASL